MAAMSAAQTAYFAQQGDATEQFARMQAEPKHMSDSDKSWFEQKMDKVVKDNEDMLENETTYNTIPAGLIIGGGTAWLIHKGFGYLNAAGQFVLGVA
jgi:hypothetical protein